jgi:hypothetical protein
MDSSNAGSAVRTFFEDLWAVDVHAVDADDRLVEALRAGQTPTDGGPLGALLARWHDACAVEAVSHAC